MYHNFLNISENIKVYIYGHKDGVSVNVYFFGYFAPMS